MNDSIKYCAYCGIKLLAPDVQYCHNCGHPILTRSIEKLEPMHFKGTNVIQGDVVSSKIVQTDAGAWEYREFYIDLSQEGQERRIWKPPYPAVCELLWEVFKPRILAEINARTAQGWELLNPLNHNILDLKTGTDPTRAVAGIAVSVGTAGLADVDGSWTEVAGAKFTLRRTVSDQMSTDEAIIVPHVELAQKREPYHWKEALSTGACLIGGFVVIGSSADSDSVWLAIFGGLAIVLAIAGFVVTNGWQRADDLSGKKKILAYLPVILGGVAAFALIALLWLIWQGLQSVADGN
jgi:hypothetical protein